MRRRERIFSLMSLVNLLKKFSAGFIHVNRKVFKHTITRVFLTGDGVANLADIQFYAPVDRVNSCDDSDHQSISAARVIFCPSHRVDDLFENFGAMMNPEVLIFGNSDHDFLDFKWKLPSTVKAVFLQNSFISDGFFRTLPIGIENIRYGRNGFRFLFSRILTLVPKKNLALSGPFSITHPDRLKIKELKGDQIFVMNNLVSPLRFAWIMSRHQFVLAPRGNGVDTHRLWEALYRGCIPILKRDAWSESIEALQLPVILINEWNDEEVKLAINSFEIPHIKPIKMQSLWLSFWKREVEAILS